MPDRTYSDREVAAIIARAAEDQRLAPAPDGASGLTLAEIQRAGREAGLDPEALRRAAVALDAGALRPDALPAATTVAERWVENARRPGDWEDAISHLRLTLGATAAPDGSGPDVTTMGTDVEWRHATLSGVRTTITLSPRGGQTRLRVARVDSGVTDPRLYALLLSGAASFLVAMLAGGLVAEGLGLGDLAGILVVLVVTALGMAVGGPAVVRRMDARRTRHVREAAGLADDLARYLAREVHAPHLGAEAEGGVEGREDASPEPRLDLSALDDEPPESEAPRPRHRSRT